MSFPRSLAVALVCAAVPLAAAQTAPRLVVPEKVKEYGVVAKGEKIDASFTLRNSGDAPLEIRAVRPTCGCTVAEYSREIAPGAEGSVDAVVDTARFSGPITKSILVSTNDPKTPNVSLVVKATVQPYLEVLPRPLVRFNAIQGEPATQKVTVVSAQKQPFAVTGVTADQPYVTTTVRELTGEERIQGRAGDQYEIVLALAEDAPIGALNSTVAVTTDHPKAPQIDVKAYGVVRSLLHVTPSQLQFGTVESKIKPGRNLIVVNNRPDETVRITEVEIDDPAFEAESFTIEEGKRYQITVTVKPDAKPGTRTATLTIGTDDPDPRYASIDVPIAANLR